MRNILFFLLATVLLAHPAFAAWTAVRPQGNSSGVEVANQSHAYDGVSSTFLAFNVTDQDVSFYNMDIGAHTDTENVVRVDITFDLSSSGLTDDQWALAYADNNGTSITYLRPFSADSLTRQNISFDDVQNYNMNNWSWTLVRDALRIIIRGTNDSVRDYGSLAVHEISVNVTYDAESPTIVAAGPANNSVYQAGSTLNFTYTVSDLSTIQNCSLLINGTTNATHLSPERDVQKSFTASFDNLNYTWQIACKDLPGFVGATGASTFEMDANRPPSVVNVTIPPVITTTLGDAVSVACNATVYDPDGQADITAVTGRAYAILSGNGDADESGSHITNASCSILAIDGFRKNVSCGFLFRYYAKPGTWLCNITAADYNGSVGFETAQANVTQIWGLNLTPLVLDYGSLDPGQNSSSDTVLTVENIGNGAIDISLAGYGLVPEDGLAMYCSTGNISIGYERHSVDSGVVYPSMISLTAMPLTQEFGLEPKNDTFSAKKNVYWKMGVPKGLGGSCTGNVVVGVILK